MSLALHAQLTSGTIDGTFLSVTSHINCIVTCWPDKRCLSQHMCLYQVIMKLQCLNDVVNDVESTQKLIISSQSLV